MGIEKIIIHPASLRPRIIHALQWMTDDMVAHHKMDNPDKDGDYSPELRDALELLGILKEGQQ